MWRPKGDSLLTIDLYMFRRTEIEERILGAGFHVEAKRSVGAQYYV